MPRTFDEHIETLAAAARKRGLDLPAAELEMMVMTYLTAIGQTDVAVQVRQTPDDDPCLAVIVESLADSIRTATAGFLQVGQGVVELLGGIGVPQVDERWLDSQEARLAMTRAVAVCKEQGVKRHGETPDADFLYLTLKAHLVAQTLIGLSDNQILELGPHRLALLHDLPTAARSGIALKALTDGLDRNMLKQRLEAN